MSDNVKKVGVYSIRAGGSAKDFWPLEPYASVGSVLPPAPVAPAAQGATGTSNTIVVPPVFAIFDIVIIMSADPVHQDLISKADSSDKLVRTISGLPSESSMPLVLDDDGKIHICFAAPPNKGDLTSNKSAAGSFEGTLHLEAKLDPGAHTVILELPLKAAKLTVEDNMFIFFVVHKKPPKTYCWTKIRAVERSDPAKFVTSHDFRLKVMRDNLQNGFKDINRRVQLTSNMSGFLSCQILPLFGLFSEGRFVLGLPINWPLIFNSNDDYLRFDSTMYMPRGHMIKLKSANIKNNLEPFEPDPIRLTRVVDVTLSANNVMLDAGHGVVYAYTDNRRSQEWYVAHLIVDRIAEILVQELKMPSQNLHLTRSAGFGLIRPNAMHANNAPEAGELRYTFDLVQQKICARQNTVELKEISDLLLTRHDASGAPLAVPEAARTRLLLINTITLNSIVHRINQLHLAQNQRVQLKPDGSPTVRWDSNNGPEGNYVLTLERVHPAPGQALIVDDTAHLPIASTDWFNVDDAMMRVLAERSARWSLANEVGSGPPADAGTNRPKFSDNVRNIMASHDAFNYMVAKILFYLGPVTLLGLPCAAGDQQITIPISVAPGATLTIDKGADAEDISVTKVNSAAPFTLDLSSRLAHAHPAGARVKVHPPPAYLTKGTKAWHIQPRVDFMNSLQGSCDLFLTLHENALWPNGVEAVGGAALVKTAASPPQNQIRQAKIFIKYLDAFDFGLRQGGIADNVAGLLASSNHVRGQYTYFELEFMDCLNVDDSSQYRYQQMVEGNFVNLVARQIVSGIVEILVDVQPNAQMDVVRYNGEWSLW